MAVRFLVSFIAFAFALVVLSFLYDKTSHPIFAYTAIVSFFGCLIMMIMTVAAAFDEFLNK